MTNFNIQENTQMKGRYVIRKYKSTWWSKLLSDEMNNKLCKMGVRSPIMKLAVNNLLVSSDGYGKNIVARQLVGDTTYQIEIDSAAIGTDNTAPSTSDTALGASVLSGIAVADSEALNNVATLDFFIADGSLANGTYYEFGLFANSRLFARSIISGGYAKSSGEDTQVSYEITV